ncbi:MAG TPA: hypothetical protein DDW73_11315 [Rhizobium sp.]|jgi:5-carboxymethyl-2-hydroxymuconate isomerase|nr:hypothetical protein [Rhizobium sp.]
MISGGGIMPHFNIEYSSNLDGRVDFDALCGRILDKLLESVRFRLNQQDSKLSCFRLSFLENWVPLFPDKL